MIKQKCNKCGKEKVLSKLISGICWDCRGKELKEGAKDEN